MSTEKWKDIVGYEGMYQVSNKGGIKSLNYRRQKYPQIIKQGIDAHGYPKIRLSRNGKRTEYKVHRLVANAFLKNTNLLPEVNHKDGNKTNNNVSNLEWVTKLDNLKHQYENNLSSINARKKEIVAICLNNGETIRFKSIAEAGRCLGMDRSHITHCLTGKYKSSKGYKFKLLSKKGA